MKIKNVYIKPDGQICACTQPVPEAPPLYFTHYVLNGATYETGQSAQVAFTKALQSCKKSSVRFEDQDAMNRLLGFRVERDTFYPLTAMMTFTCNNDCQADVGDCCHPSNCAKVARLIPEAKEEKPNNNNMGDFMTVGDGNDIDTGFLYGPTLKGPDFSSSESAPIVEESDRTFIIDFCTWRDNKAWEFDYREQKSHTIKEQLEIYKSITRKP